MIGVCPELFCLKVAYQLGHDFIQIHYLLAFLQPNGLLNVLWLGDELHGGTELASFDCPFVFLPFLEINRFENNLVPLQAFPHVIGELSHRFMNQFLWLEVSVPELDHLSGQVMSWLLAQ